MKHNRTRQAIADAFTHLLAEHTIDKITVKMITDEAGCSRKTFYYYFTDIYDLTHYVCEQKVHSYLRSSVDVASMREGFQALMNYLDSERPVVLNMFRGYGKQELERFTWQATEQYTRKLIAGNPASQGLSREDLEAVIHMYSYMLFGMMVDWISKEMSGDYGRTLELALSALPLLVYQLSQSSK